MEAEREEMDEKLKTAEKQSLSADGKTVKQVLSSHLFWFIFVY